MKNSISNHSKDIETFDVKRKSLTVLNIKGKTKFKDYYPVTDKSIRLFCMQNMPYRSYLF